MNNLRLVILSLFYILKKYINIYLICFYVEIEISWEDLLIEAITDRKQQSITEIFVHYKNLIFVYNECTMSHMVTCYDCLQRDSTNYCGMAYKPRYTKRQHRLSLISKISI